MHRPDRRGRLGPVLRDPAFLTLILVGGLIQASHAVLYSFGSLFWHDRSASAGSRSARSGRSAVACEIVLFMWSGPLMRRVGPLGLLALGGTAAIVRWLCFPLEPGFLGYAAPPGAARLHLRRRLCRQPARHRPRRAGGAHRIGPGRLRHGRRALRWPLAMLVAGPLYHALGGNGFLVMAILPAVSRHPRRLSPPCRRRGESCLSPRAPAPAGGRGYPRSGGPGSRSRASSSGPSRSTKSALWARSRAGAIASDVPTMHPTMIAEAGRRASLRRAPAPRSGRRSCRA